MSKVGVAVPQSSFTQRKRVASLDAVDVPKGSQHLVVLRANAQGVADASVEAGSSQQVGCRAQVGSQQSLPSSPQQGVGQPGVSPHRANSAVSGGSSCNPDFPLDLTFSAVPSQGGAVEICSQKPLEYHKPSPSPSSAQELNPEDFARQLLTKRDFSAVSALRLVDLLPRDLGLRHGGSRLGLGAYWGMGKLAIFKSTCTFPQSCKYLCALVPQHVFGAIDILDDVLSEVHQDLTNQKGSCSLVVPLTHFAQGQLWVEDETGNHIHTSGRCGRLRNFDDGPCVFDPRKKHAVLPWHGRRVTLAAYMPRGVLEAPADMRSDLSILGFVFRVFPTPLLVCPLKDPRLPVYPLSRKGQWRQSPREFRRLAKWPEDLLVVELCAGAAILSSTAARKGFRVMAVDNHPRRAPAKQILRIDLADHDAVSELLEIIRMERDRLVLLFISPPCGTASLARERKLLKWARKGFKIPAPLRSRSFPDMLPGLKGWGKVKVELANQLYQQVTRISIFAISLGILVMIENPASSLYWLTSFFLESAHFCPGHNVDFHSCCHGGQRAKLTRFWVSQDHFLQLSMSCDNTHWHKPWAPRKVGNRLRFVTAARRLRDTASRSCHGPSRS